MLAAALVFAAVVLGLNSIDVADSVSCSDRAEIRAAAAKSETVECFDGSDAAKSATVFLGFASAALALIGAIGALIMALRARMNGYLMPATVGALVLGAAAIVVNNL